jgi:hypothetical protein
MKYSEYLESKEWHAKVDIAMKYYGNNCVLCGNTKNLSAHHRTYKNLYNETVFDLIILCKRCHKFVHQKLIDTSDYALQIQECINYQDSQLCGQIEVNKLFEIYEVWHKENYPNKQPVRIERFKQVLKRMYKANLEDKYSENWMHRYENAYFNFDKLSRKD